MNNNFKYNFSVLGMTCINCANHVEKSLKKIDGVKFAAVNLATESAFIVADKNIAFEEIKKTIKSAGYDISTENPDKLEKQRFIAAKRNIIIVWILTLPISILMILNMIGIKIPGFEWAELIIGIIVIFYIGFSTIKGAWIAFIHYHTNMDTLIFIGSVSAWITSAFKIAGFNFSSFGTIGSMIMALHLTGRFIESYLRDKASKEIKSLINLQSKEAQVITETGEEILMPIETVKEGFIVLVKPGERIPVDGEIISGISSIDESMITGESVPVKKEKGQQVTGGSLNITGTLKIKTTKTGENAFLNKMVQLIKEAQGSKIPIQALADSITKKFVPIIIFLALLSAVIWFFNYDTFCPYLQTMNKYISWIPQTNALSFAIFVFIAVIVIACPCALGLATPMALIVGTGLAAKNGLIIRNAESIQTSKNVKAIIMDKTGTITEGHPSITTHTIPKNEVDIIAAIENNSNHPLAKAITKISENNKLKIETINEIAGKGIETEYNGHKYFIGKPTNKNNYIEFFKSGQTVVEVYKNDNFSGYIVIADKIRNDSKITIQKFKNSNILPIMATGDNKITAEAVAETIGIETIYSEIKPQEKLDIVRKYQSEGLKVMMIGDGMNDAAALKGADIGVAIGSGTDLAIDNSDVIIVKGGLSKIINCVTISRITYKTIKYNLFWAFIYNIIAIPLAMSGLLHPAIAESAMALSSITVILNSTKIRKNFNKLKTQE